jgi:hypothetical protein
MTDPGSKLIDSMVRDLQPVRPVRIGAVLALLLALEVVVLIVGTSWGGIRPDIGQRLRDPRFVAFVAILLASAVGSAWAALRLSVPGRELSGRAFAALFLLPSLAAAAAVALLPWGGRWTGIGSMMGACWHCISFTAATALVPWLGVVLTVSRLAPLNPARVGILAGLSAFALGAVGTQLHCGCNDGYHLALGHYLPVLAMALITGAIVARVLRMRTDARSASGVKQ